MHADAHAAIRRIGEIRRFLENYRLQLRLAARGVRQHEVKIKENKERQSKEKERGEARPGQPKRMDVRPHPPTRPPDALSERGEMREGYSPLPLTPVPFFYPPPCSCRRLRWAKS